MGLFSSGKREAEPELAEPEGAPALFTVQIYGPQGPVETFVLVGDDDNDVSIDETSVSGCTAEGKEVNVTGLGGAFIAVVKQN